MKVEVTANIRGCARCGGDHARLTFVLFARPPYDATHWARCPSNGDPILLTVSTAMPELASQERSHDEPPPPADAAQ